MTKQTKKVYKKFECKGKCKNPKLESVVFGCDACIKKVVCDLNAEQRKTLMAVLKVMLM